MKNSAPIFSVALKLMWLPPLFYHSVLSKNSVCSSSDPTGSPYNGFYVNLLIRYYCMTFSSSKSPFLLGPLSDVRV
jgi:hypothetical protein